MTRAHLTIAGLLAVSLMPLNASAQSDTPAAQKPAASPMKKLSSKQPIEITSDTLEVYQEENRAVFTGNVVAIQGDTRLKSDKMTVFYRKPDEKTQGDANQPKAPKPAKAAGSDDSVKQDAIKHIDVVGHVVMSRPEDTAIGEIGDYDVESHEIHLHNKVTLTHGNNTLKGEHLTYNLDTGQSVLTGGPETTASAAQPAKALPSGRVRALFVPDDKNAKNPDAAKTSGKAGVTAGDTKTDTTKTTDKKPDTTSTAP